jgi:hypothetical protein
MATIVERKRVLKNLLHEGNLTPQDNLQLKAWFETFYTPDLGDVKYTLDEIDTFFIGRSTMYNTPCFHVRLKNGKEDVVSTNRLAGEGRTQYESFTRALRVAIDPQIETFKHSHPLNPDAQCPVETTMLGRDAQVDHFQPPFYVLVKDWLDEIKTTPTVKYLQGNYRLTEPYHTSWVEFHAKRANLRWVSKEGNKKSHLLTQSKA